MDVNTDIFKAYDVRGLYPSELDEQTFRAIGRAFVSFLGAKRIGVGQDMRLSSPSLTAAFMEGARTQGADIVDYGMIATDMLYYGVARDDLDGGVQITASHNPGEYNGAKLVGRQAFPLSGDKGISDIREMLLHDRLPEPARAPGSVTSRDLLAGYLTHVLGFVDSCHHPAVPHGARCRERHGRSRGATALRAAALPDDATVLRRGRNVSSSRSQSAHRGQPAGHRRARHG